MSFELWLAFATASLAIVIIPGPTVLLTLSYAISQGRKVAISCAAGVALGDLIAISAALAGLGAIIATSALAFTVLKWVGAAYLLFLGLRMFRSAAKVDDTQEAPPKVVRSIFWHAALVTALNPKSIGFFVAFMPQFIAADAAFLPQAAILTATFVAIGAGNALTYALAADAMGSQLKRPGIMKRLTQGGGIALMGMGAMTATLRRTAP